MPKTGLRKDQPLDQESAKILGRFLEKHRAEAGYTIEQVSESLHLVAETIRGFEDGTMPLPLEDLLAFANFYNIDPDEVVKLLYSIGIDDEWIS